MKASEDRAVVSERNIEKFSKGWAESQRWRGTRVDSMFVVNLRVTRKVVYFEAYKSQNYMTVGYT